MIETVQERQRGGIDFSAYYDNLCALKDVAPSQAVKAHLAQGVIDINGDRLRTAEWEPLLNALRINKTLEFVAIRSYFHLNVDEDAPEKLPIMHRSRIPVLRSKPVTFGVCQALRGCLATSESLSCVELQGLPLRERDVRALAKGIMNNGTLHHLSVEFCRIGDIGLEIICGALKVAGNITTLNLSGCSLTARGMEFLIAVIKYQGMCRHNEAWKESLRYRRPNLDSMPGLRRITLNHNPLLGDKGAVCLAEVLKDDVWVKALDLHNCGINNISARAFLGLLKFNASLVVLDLRLNPLIDKDLLRAVTEQVLVNCDDKDSEFKWLKAVDIFQQRKVWTERSKYTGPTKPLDATQRPAFKPSGPVFRSRSAEPPQSQQVRGRSASIDLHRSQTFYDVRLSSRTDDSTNQDSARGLPWRTAARASRYRCYPTDHTPGKAHLDENSETGSVVGPITIKTAPLVGYQPPEDVVNPLLKEFSECEELTPTEIKGLKIEMLRLKREHVQESTARKELQEKLYELSEENDSLRRELAMHRWNEERRNNEMRSLVREDEALLLNIEHSFAQFHSFLDLLREAGLGRMVSAAGMDQFGSPQLRQPHTPRSPSGKATLPRNGQRFPNSVGRQKVAGRTTGFSSSGRRAKAGPNGSVMHSSVQSRYPIGPSSNVAVSNFHRSRQLQKARKSPENQCYSSTGKNSSGQQLISCRQSRSTVRSVSQRDGGNDKMVGGAPSDISGSMHTNAGISMDLIEEAYQKARQTKSEADRLFAKLKEATQSTIMYERGDHSYTGSRINPDFSPLRQSHETETHSKSVIVSQEHSPEISFKTRSHPRMVTPPTPPSKQRNSLIGSDGNKSSTNQIAPPILVSSGSQLSVSDHHRHGNEMGDSLTSMNYEDFTVSQDNLPSPGVREPVPGANSEDAPPTATNTRAPIASPTHVTKMTSSKRMDLIDCSPVHDVIEEDIDGLAYDSDVDAESQSHLL